MSDTPAGEGSLRRIAAIAFKARMPCGLCNATRLNGGPALEEERPKWDSYRGSGTRRCGVGRSVVGGRAAGRRPVGYGCPKVGWFAPMLPKRQCGRGEGSQSSGRLSKTPMLKQGLRELPETKQAPQLSERETSSPGGRGEKQRMDRMEGGRFKEPGRAKSWSGRLQRRTQAGRRQFDRGQ